MPCHVATGNLKNSGGRCRVHYSNPGHAPSQSQSALALHRGRSTHITRAIRACTDRPGASNQHLIQSEIPSSAHCRHAPVLISALNQMRDAAPHDMQMNSGNQAAPRLLTVPATARAKGNFVWVRHQPAKAIAHLHRTRVTLRSLVRSWKLLHLTLTDNVPGVVSDITDQINKL